MSDTPEEHEPRTEAKRVRREGLGDALAAAIDTPLRPHQAGRKRRREDGPSGTLSQTSYSDAESATCTDADHVSEEGPIDLGLKLAEFPSDLLVLLAERRSGTRWRCSSQRHT